LLVLGEEDVEGFEVIVEVFSPLNPSVSSCLHLKAKRGKRTYALSDFGIPILLLIRSPGRSIPDNLFQGGFEIRRLRCTQPDKSSLGGGTELFAKLLKQEVLGGDVWAGDDEARRDFTAGT
jgi:hypothetical protein